MWREGLLELYCCEYGMDDGEFGIGMSGMVRR